MGALSHEEQARLDEHIFGKEILRGILFMRDLLGLTLVQAQDQFGIRYRELLDSRDERFTLSDTEYRKGFQS